MTDHTEDPAPVEEDEQSRGAMTLVLFYLIVIIGLWVYTYSILLSRN